MRILRWHLKVELPEMPKNGWSSFEACPPQEITDEQVSSIAFDAIVKAIKKAGMTYTVIERTEKELFSGGTIT